MVLEKMENLISHISYFLHKFLPSLLISRCMNCRWKKNLYKEGDVEIRLDFI